MATSLCDANISESEDDIPKWMLARKGLQLLINNREQEAVELFEKYPDSIHMYAGHATTLFIVSTFQTSFLFTMLIIIFRTL